MLSTMQKTMYLSYVEPLRMQVSNNTSSVERLQHEMPSHAD